MRRALLVAVLAVGATLIAVAVSASGNDGTSARTASAKPVLAGPWSSYQEGYGHAEPPTIFNGGDGSGLVNHIEWLAWGGPKAVGLGKGLYVAPGLSNAEGTRESAVVVLFNLGTCHGKRTYNAVTWFYPEHGDHFDSRSYINACNGSYHE